MTIVKIFKATDEKATVVTKDGNIRYDVVLDETLRNKMCRRLRAFFQATPTDDGQFALYKRVPDQKW
jgi:hypothetical protein